MKKFLFLAVLAWLGYQQWHKHQVAQVVADSTSDNGFVTMPVPTGYDARGVIIFAPENCPSEAAQRAEDLAHRLSSENIPVTRASQANFSFASPDSAVLERVNTVMSGEVPIVFVRGKGKANPSFSEVLAEYGQ